MSREVLSRRERRPPAKPQKNDVVIVGMGESGHQEQKKEPEPSPEPEQEQLPIKPITSLAQSDAEKRKRLNANGRAYYIKNRAKVLARIHDKRISNSILAAKKKQEELERARKRLDDLKLKELKTNENDQTKPQTT